MRDLNNTLELEAQVTSDKQRYDEIQRQEADLLENVPPQGFSAFAPEVRYRAEKEALADSIVRGEEVLAADRRFSGAPMCRLRQEDIAVAAYFLWLKDSVNRPEIMQGQDFYWFEAERDLRHECVSTGGWHAV